MFDREKIRSFFTLLSFCVLTAPGKKRDRDNVLQFLATGILQVQQAFSLDKCVEEKQGG